MEIIDQLKPVPGNVLLLMIIENIICTALYQRAKQEK